MHIKHGSLRAGTLIENKQFLSLKTDWQSTQGWPVKVGVGGTVLVMQVSPPVVLPVNNMGFDEVHKYIYSNLGFYDHYDDVW